MRKIESVQVFIIIRKTSKRLSTTPQSRKNRWVAVVLSFFLPGFGQIYASKAERGASILVGSILVFTAAYFFIAQTGGRGILFDIGSRYLQLLAILFWAWQVYDAYSLKA